MEHKKSVTARVTAKDFFLWAGAMIALYWSAVAFMFLLFSYIDYTLPNSLQWRVDPYEGGMPFQMASLLVLVPVFVTLLYFIRRDIRSDSSRTELWVRRWGIISTLFIAGITVAGDAITLLSAFFSGDELTGAFLLKVLVVLVVAATGFTYFMLDLRDYWNINRSKERAFGISLIGVALVAIFSGFLIVGTPSQARLMRIDTQRVSDLQSIQWQLVNYWQAKQSLPDSLETLTDPLSGFSAPRDPDTDASYEYKIVSSTSFELCAVFSEANSNPSINTYEVVRPAKDGAITDSWAHDKGRTCFTRTIDPELYPATPKVVR